VRIQSLLAEPTGDEWFTGQTSEERPMGSNGHAERTDPPNAWEVPALTASGGLGGPTPPADQDSDLAGSAGSPRFEIEFDAALTIDAPLGTAKEDGEDTADSEGLTSASRAAHKTPARLKRRVPRP
jgi:hypothetical protein